MYNLIFDNDASNIWCYDEGENSLFSPSGASVSFTFDNNSYGVRGEYPFDCTDIRIFLGYACNYSCKYCIQHNIKEIDVSADIITMDIKKFVHALRLYYEKNFTNRRFIVFSLWGGEPLLYFEKFKILHKALYEEFNQYTTVFGTCTNGALLKGEKAQYLIDNGIRLTLSYDGPGQFVRNESDVLATGSPTLEAFLEGKSKCGWNITTVMHKYNPSIRDHIYYVSEKLKTDDWKLIDAVELRITDKAHLNYVYTDREAEKEIKNRTDFLLFDKYWNKVYADGYLRKRAYRFARALSHQYVCGDCIIADNDKYLRVDSNGDIWGCSNCQELKYSRGGTLLHGGNIYEGTYNRIAVEDVVKENMQHCDGCVLRYLCLSGCKLTPPEFNSENCRMLQVMYYPLFFRLFSDFMGKTLTSISPVEV